MQNGDMVRMANQIAAYFEAYPRAEALAGISNHIKNFWNPRMRKQLDEFIGEGAEGLSPLVVSAIMPKGKEPPAAKAAAVSTDAALPKETQPKAAAAKEPGKSKNGSKAKGKGKA